MADLKTETKALVDKARKAALGLSARTSALGLHSVLLELAELRIAISTGAPSLDLNEISRKKLEQARSGLADPSADDGDRDVSSVLTEMFTGLSREIRAIRELSAWGSAVALSSVAFVVKPTVTAATPNGVALVPGVGTTPNFSVPGQVAIDASATASILAERATQVVAAGTTIAVTDGSPVTPFTTSGSVTNTAAPFIAAGRNGQLVILRNDNGSGTLTLSDTNIGAGGSLLRLSANTVTMAAGSTMALEYSTIQGAWVELWYQALVAVVPAINSFTVDGQSSSLTHEWGDGVTANDTAPAFVASYTGVPSAADAWLDGAPANAFSAPYLTLTGAVYFRSATRNGTRAFVLHATVNGTGLISGTVTVTYRAPNYAGVSTQTTGLTSAQVVALTHFLDTNPYATYSSIPATGAGDYIWFAFIDNDATLDSDLFFAIGGERAKFDLKDNPVAVTSTYLKIANYETYRSTLAQLGTVTVVVQSSRPPTKRYVGKVGQATQLSEAQIEALQLSDLTESSNGTFASITGLGAGDYLWFCVPAVVSAPVHYGISPGNGSSGYQEAAFTAAAAQSVTNQYGFTDAAVKNIHSDVTGFQAVNINNSTTSTWSLKTQASAFANRIYMGPGPATDPITNANILALDDTASGSSNLQTTVPGSYAVTIAGGNYLWFCHPDAVPDLGTIKDHATGFGIDGAYMTNVSHVNDFGVTETYRCWRSTNPSIFPSGGTVDVT